MRAIEASDLMTPEVLTVRDDLTVTELATFLIENEITGAAVENDEGKLVGVVSVTDVAAAAAEGGQPRYERSDPDFYLTGWEESFNEDEVRRLRVKNEGVLVRDIMNPAVYSVESDTRVPEIAKAMLEGHLHRLLVTKDDEVVGIISTSDLLGLFLDEDD